MHRRVALGRARALGAIVASMTLVATLSFTGVSQATPADTAGSGTTSTDKAAEPTWTVALASDPATGATVAPGAEVGITLTVSNTGAVDLPAGAQVTSDLAEPLAHAAIAEPAKLVAAGLAVVGTKLTWTVPGIAAKDAAQTNFSLTVADDADGSTLSIAAAPQGAEKCAVATCETTLTVAAPPAETTSASPTPFSSDEPTSDSPTSGTAASSSPESSTPDQTTDTTTTPGTSTSESTNANPATPGSSTSAEGSTSPATASGTPDSPTTSAPPNEPAIAAAAAAADDPGVIVPQAVPPATGNNAVITVKVGGNRLTTAAVGPLAGVTLTLYDGVNAPTTPATGLGGTPENPNTCVSDADGDCSWIIGNTQTDGANHNRRFWVVQTGVPAGWLQNSSLITGPDGGPFVATPYRFRTGTVLQNGGTYSSTNRSWWAPATPSRPRPAESGRTPRPTRWPPPSVASTSRWSSTSRARCPDRCPP